MGGEYDSQKKERTPKNVFRFLFREIKEKQNKNEFLQGV